MPAVLSVAKIVKWSDLAVTRNYCPLCDTTRFFIKLQNNDVWVRCLSCRSSAITLSVIDVLRDTVEEISTKDIYELSSRGKFVDYLRRMSKSLTCSEYFHGVEPGDYCSGVQCQDIQNLTHADNTFDVCTSTEVFEHVPDDGKGFSEIYRVLKPGGAFVFTVPLNIKSKTIERATLQPDGQVEHLLEPEYHSDPIRSHDPILAFRNYGYDIVERLNDAGFKNAQVVLPNNALPWGFSRRIVVADKP